MALTAEEKQEIITKYATHEGDTGSPEVQVAILTERINILIHMPICKTPEQGMPGRKFSYRRRPRRSIRER